MRRLLFALPLILFAACGGSVTGPSGPIDTRVTVTLGNSTTIDGADLTVRFDAVNDSRCPGDAMCVSPGHAVVTLSVDNGSRRQQVELKTDPAGARAATVNGLRFELVQVDPYPFVNRPTPAPPYQATVRVTR